MHEIRKIQWISEMADEVIHEKELHICMEKKGKE